MCGKDPDETQCKVCKSTLNKSDLADHMIAHKVHEKQIERAEIERVAQVNQYFEDQHAEREDHLEKNKAKKLNKF